MKSRAFMRDSDVELICKNSFYFSLYYFDDEDFPILDCTDNKGTIGNCHRCVFQSTANDTCTISDSDALSPEQVHRLQATCPEMFI